MGEFLFSDGLVQMAAKGCGIKGKNRLAGDLPTFDLRDRRRRAHRQGRHHGPVEHLVDLDDLAARLRGKISGWASVALLEAFTWRDENAAYPQVIRSDRAEVEVPESLGLRLSLRSGDEAAVVVWTGGWADIDLLLNGRIFSHCPEFPDVNGAYATVVRAVEDFLARSR